MESATLKLQMKYGSFAGNRGGRPVPPSSLKIASEHSYISKIQDCNYSSLLDSGFNWTT